MINLPRQASDARPRPQHPVRFHVPLPCRVKEIRKFAKLPRPGTQPFRSSTDPAHVPDGGRPARGICGGVMTGRGHAWSGLPCHGAPACALYVREASWRSAGSAEHRAAQTNLTLASPSLQHRAGIEPGWSRDGARMEHGWSTDGARMEHGWSTDGAQGMIWSFQGLKDLK